MVPMKLFMSNKDNLGLPPGTVSSKGQDEPINLSSLSVLKLNYNESFFNKEEINEMAELEKALSAFKKDQVTWINIDSSEANIVKKVGDALNIHPLVQEDIVNVHQLPKVEDWDNYIYVVIRMFYYDKEKKKTIQEQVSFILGDNFLISFQEKPGDVFNIIRTRIENAKGRVRTMKADYLLYCLLDSIVDQYFVVLNKYSELAETTEDMLENKSSNKSLKEIQKLKREVLFNRRYIVPVGELVNSLLKTESSLIDNKINPFLNDLYDHASQVNQAVEMLREFIVSIIEIAHSSLSNKMNDIMKVLTIISTIFIPITFLAGIYGMNFEHMPELKFTYAYPTLIAVMISVAIAMLVYFKKKKWW